MDELVYGRVGLWMSWSVDELVVDELDCGRDDESTCGLVDRALDS